MPIPISFLNTFPDPCVHASFFILQGMVEAAIYIRDKLEKEQILTAAFAEAGKGQPRENFGLVLVGHSLGAGTASILAILLRQTYPDLQCFAYSPPGGLLR